MTKIEIDNERFEVIRESANEEVCKKCYFDCLKCPVSDEWPYFPLCNDYEDDNTVAYFKRIE
jgi:hypothetical protein